MNESENKKVNKMFWRWAKGLFLAETNIKLLFSSSQSFTLSSFFSILFGTCDHYYNQLLIIHKNGLFSHEENSFIIIA